MWIICCILSIVFTGLNWKWSGKQTQKAIWASLCAISFMALTVLMEYRLVLDWVNKSDWSALMDVVPSMFKMLTGYVILLLLANMGAFLLNRENKL